MNPILMVILIGTYDEGSNFFCLQGMWHILKNIWNNVKFAWKAHIQYFDDSPFSLREVEYDFINNWNNRDPFDSSECYGELDMAFLDTTWSQVDFPPPSNININMMPFIMSKEFEGTKLPEYLRKYWISMVSKCHINEEEKNKIGYLTIQENLVPENKSQRRPGLHVESPGAIRIPSSAVANKGEGDGHVEKRFFLWGAGAMKRNYALISLMGGIFMASSVDDSCCIWNCKILPDENDEEIIGNLGDIEHLRELLPEPVITKKNSIYWFTDRTPHESMPLKTGGYRQFFRLVTSNVTGWYENHSTSNPNGVVPDPLTTWTISGSKFKT